MAGYRRRYLLTVLYAAAACLVAPASSSAEKRDFALEEVVVTARKKEESLQETPVAVSAFSSDALREANIRDVTDFNRVIPGIDVSTTNGNAPQANIFIRGVGQRNTGANVDSGIGIYLDGVYFARPDGALLDINDISSVEVLRGPQGTIFGKNNTGGAIVFNTNKPTDEFDAKFSVTGGNFSRRDASAMINLPITDALKSRLAVISKSRDGFIDNAFLDKDFVDEERLAALLKFRAEPSENLTLDLNLDWSRVNSSPYPMHCEVVPEVTGWLAELLDTLVLIPATGRKYVDFCTDNQRRDGGNPRVTESEADNRYFAEAKGAALQAHWAIGETMNFKSITAYRNTDAAQDDDIDATSLVFNRAMHGHPIDEPRNTDQFSQEFQLSGDALEGELSYLAGFYYFNEETDSGIYRTLVLTPTETAATLFVNASATETLAESEAFAIFAQSDWEIWPDLRLTTGLRFTTEEREVTLNTFLPDPDTFNKAQGGLPPIDIGGTGLYVKAPGPFEFNENYRFVYDRSSSDSFKNDAWTPMISLQYLLQGGDLIDGGTAYATVSRGFLSGGLNESPTGVSPFKPETVTNYEMGLKLDLLDRRLRLNSTLFTMDYENRQLTTLVISPDTNSPSGATINAAESSISGLEIESLFLVTQSLMITANASWYDGEIKEFEDTRITYAEPGAPPPPPNCERINIGVSVDSCTVDRSDESLPRLPERTVYLAAQYSFYTPYGTITPRIDASLKYGLEYCFDRGSCIYGLPQADRQEQYGASLSWRSPREHYSLILQGSNLTDATYVVGGVPLVDAFGTSGITVNPPRMWTLEFSARFGG